MNSSVTNSHHDLHNYDAPCQGPSNRNDLPVQPCRCRAAERPETSRGRELVFLGGAAGRYSISEFWLELRTRGPGVHAHPEDHVFYVIAGTLSLRVNKTLRPEALRPGQLPAKKSGKYLSKSGRDCCLLAPHSPKLWQARHRLGAFH